MNKIYESNIWKVYATRVITALELSIAVYVLFLMANNLSMTQIMILEVFFIGLALILEVPSGAFADLYGRKNSMIIGMFAVTVAFIVFGFSTNFWHFLIGNLLVATGVALNSGANEAFIFDSLKECAREKEYAKIIGRANFLSLMVWGSTSLVSATLGEIFGFRPLYFFSAGSFFIGMIIMIFYKEPPIHKHIYEANYFKHLRDAVKFSYNHKTVWNLIVFFGIVSATTHLTWLVIQAYYGTANLPSIILGIAMFLYFAVSGIGNLIAGRFIKMFSKQTMLFAILLSIGLSYIGIVVFGPIAGLFFIIIMSLGSGFRDVFISDEINKRVESRQRATVISVQNVSKNIVYILLAPLIGVFTDIFTFGAGFIVMGSGLMIYFLFLIVSVKIRKNSIID
ncbi:MFS transporter [Bacteroidota bacterium]